MSIRPPGEIYMTDHQSCVSCATLQVLYMFGFEEPPFDISVIDRRIDRMPGEPCSPIGSYLELMRHGLNLTQIHSKSFHANTYEALRHALVQENPEAELTISQFKQIQAQQILFQKALQKVPGKLEGISHPTDSTGVFHLFKERSCPVVYVPLAEQRSKFFHLAVAYKVDSIDNIYLYVPRPPSFSLFVRMTAAQIDQHLEKNEPMVGISR